jgi:ABC-type nitrate/sulfonate/bicarbonate transport system substrate-binding protein
MGIGALNHVSLTMAMEKVGINPKDFTYMATPPSLILTALDAGTIDAASLNPPFLMQALAKGYHVLLDIADLVEMPSGGLSTLTKTIETRPNDVKRMIKSLQQAKEAFVKSKDRSLQLMKDSLKLDQETALRTYDMVRASFVGDGVPTRLGMQNIVKTLHAQGLFTDKNIRFEDIADARYAREVAKELGYKVNEKE